MKHPFSFVHLDTQFELSTLLQLQPQMLNMSEKKQDEILPPETYHIDYIEKDQGPDQDAVFGEITEEGPNYRNVCASQDYMR